MIGIRIQDLKSDSCKGWIIFEITICELRLNCLYTNCASTSSQTCMIYVYNLLVKIIFADKQTFQLLLMIVTWPPQQPLSDGISSYLPESQRKARWQQLMAARGLVSYIIEQPSYQVIFFKKFYLQIAFSAFCLCQVTYKSSFLSHVTNTLL